MRLMGKQDSQLVESRFLWASVIVLIVISALLLRLWYIQIYRGEYYSAISDRNRVRRIDIPVPRGIIYDRHGEVVLGNRPFFDLVYVPQYIKHKQETFRILSRILNIPLETIEKRVRAARGQPKFRPVSLKRNLSLHEVSIVESNRVFLPGIEIRREPRRDYHPAVPPHMVGYIREVTKKTLSRNKDLYKDNPYLPGDLVGKQGLEAQWESWLRGKRGFRLVQVDAFGRQSDQSQETNWEYPVVPAEPGADLELTLDMELQKAVKKAFSGKNGAVVVMDPRNGEILAALSEPGFNPEIMQTGLSTEDWQQLTSNPFKPFLDKTTGGEFAPGSIFKPVLGMAALEEKLITPATTYHCPGHFVLGNHTFYCHKREGHGAVNLRDAIVKSCDAYFYHVGIELGVDRIASYARSFGLGDRLKLKLNMERPGLIPTSAWKQLVHKFPWTKGDTPNVAIGQGYVLMTPIQMASLYASIANHGTVYRPYLVKKVTNHVGEILKTTEPEVLTETTMISKETFELMGSILKDVVHHQQGTGKNARVAGRTVAGKTGSAQVVSLKKNRNQQDVSMKWKEHAIFTAFSPVENAEIVVAIVSENDKVGGGGRSAAPVSQEIISTYWKLKEKRKRKKISMQNEAGTGKDVIR